MYGTLAEFSLAHSFLLLLIKISMNANIMHTHFLNGEWPQTSLKVTQDRFYVMGAIFFTFTFFIIKDSNFKMKNQHRIYQKLRYFFLLVSISYMYCKNLKEIINLGYGFSGKGFEGYGCSLHGNDSKACFYFFIFLFVVDLIIYKSIKSQLGGI